MSNPKGHTVLAMCYTFFGLLWRPLCAGKVRVPVCLVSRTIAESKKKHEEKQLKAQQLREKLREEKNHKLQKLLERVSREPLVRPGPIGSRERSAARPPPPPDLLAKPGEINTLDHEESVCQRACQTPRDKYRCPPLTSGI